jgi:hypothetical protein
MQITAIKERLGINTGWNQQLHNDFYASVTQASRLEAKSLELSALDAHRLDLLELYLASDAANVQLKQFERVSVHGPIGDFDQKEWRCFLERLIKLPPIVDGIVLHPETTPPLQELKALGSRLRFENADCNKKSHQDPSSGLDQTFSLFPEAQLCLDIAHVYCVDQTMRLADELLERYSDRLGEVHISGIDNKGSHRLTRDQDLEIYALYLEHCLEVPWILEEPLLAYPKLI